MIKGDAYWIGGWWGCRTEFTAFDMESYDPEQVFHVGGCEPRIPKVGDRLYARLTRRGAPDRYAACLFTEVRVPGDPQDAFFGTVKLTHFGSLEDDKIKWEEYSRA